MGDEQNHWEWEWLGEYTSRMRVPGGWVVKASWGQDDAIALAFVPDPPPEPTTIATIGDSQ